MAGQCALYIGVDSVEEKHLTRSVNCRSGFSLNICAPNDRVPQTRAESSPRDSPRDRVAYAPGIADARHPAFPRYHYLSLSCHCMPSFRAGISRLRYTSSMSQWMSATFFGTSSGGGPSESRNCSSTVIDIVGEGSLWSTCQLCNIVTVSVIRTL